ncbi:OmpA family protein [Phenylobacterium sp.]|uniref:OmpA family protein n=1 Tax=Phenylobacterium sp. TaxID=1871053 RepID=UPI001219A733|nr:OmpA family protein [Phenylobacterium sp.]THD59438.1 MAG: OmpA family protein [Phenylobacterium sp.]
MRRWLLLALPPLLAACASTPGGSVTLLPGEPGAKVGAVAVFDPKTGAEQGVLTAENTRTRLGAKFAAKPVDPKAYAALTDALPPPAAHFTLYFVEGATTLTPESQPELQKVFAEIARRPGAEVQITGHTDTVGKESDNDMLSLKRARDIREALIAQGLNPAISRAVGRGERELLVQTPDNTAEPRNRRVEIIVR